MQLEKTLNMFLLIATNLKGVHLTPSYFANRAGLIAATQFPLLIALGMKNNILTCEGEYPYVPDSTHHLLSPDRNQFRQGKAHHCRVIPVI